MSVSNARRCGGWLIAVSVCVAALPTDAGAGFFEWKTRKYLAQVDAADRDIARRFQVQKDCCASFRDMRFEAPSGKRTRVELGPESPIFTFPEGRTKFRAFTLPKLAPGDSIALVMVERIPHTPTPRIRPMLVLLSERYDVVGVFAPASFDEGRIGLADEGKKATLTIDGASAAARYAIVAADPRWVGRKLDLEARSSAVNYGVVTIANGTPAIQLPYSYEGRTYLYIEKH